MDGRFGFIRARTDGQRYAIETTRNVEIDLPEVEMATPLAGQFQATERVNLADTSRTEQDLIQSSSVFGGTSGDRLGTFRGVGRNSTVTAGKTTLSLAKRIYFVYGPTSFEDGDSIESYADVIVDNTSGSSLFSMLANGIADVKRRTDHDLIFHRTINPIATISVIYGGR